MHYLFSKYLFSSLSIPDIVLDIKNIPLIKQIFLSHDVCVAQSERQAMNNK